MALLGAFIDSRTVAGIAANGSASFAHGLPSTPDYVIAVANVSVASATNWFGWAPTFDATNVTLQNPGAATSPVGKIISVVAHSIVR
jgi:hypothetical protein